MMGGGDGEGSRTSSSLWEEVEVRMEKRRGRGERDEMMNYGIKEWMARETKPGFIKKSKNLTLQRKVLEEGWKVGIYQWLE